MTTWTGTVPTIASGDTTTVPTNLAEYRDALKGLTEARTSWTPTYTGISAIGSATVVARYLRANKLVMGHVIITFAANTTFAATTLSVSMPVAARDPGVVVGSLFAQDTGSNDRVVGTVIESSSTFIFVGHSSDTAFTGTTVPWAWASTDILKFEFQYETA